MRGLPKYLLFLITLFLVAGLSNNFAHADTATTVDLRDYIANPNWGPAQDHSLSTGEAISYTGDGGTGPNGAAAVRQHKNSNWEQFFVVVY